MLLIMVLGKLGQPVPHGKALSQNQKKNKTTKKNQAISETYKTYKKNSIEGLKVDVINIDSTIYKF